MLDAATMRGLQQDAAQMATRNHQRYLAEALQALKRGPSEQDGGAIAPLMLLQKFQGSSYASRRDEQSALSTVGKWLEERLKRQPDVDVRRLALELGWLRRLAVWASSLEQRAPNFDRGAGPATKFGSEVDKLLEKRKKALSSRIGSSVPNRSSESPPTMAVATTQVWEAATVVWEPGPAMLIASSQNRKAAPVRTKDAATALFVDPSIAARFFAKRELSGVRIEVAVSGNSFRIERIHAR